MYAITAATGQLGRLVVDALLDAVPADRIVAAVRSPAKAADLAAKGVQVREADYDRPETLAAAFAGVERVLLISSSEVGGRLAQHRAAIDAAKAAGVKLLAYTSILHADSTPARLAIEHQETEAAIAASGVPAAILRNGWYTENKTSGLPAALEHGAMVGSSGDGRFSAASREDFAAAAAAVLAGEGQAGKIYELAGDEAFTMAELAAEVSRQAGRAVAYRNLPESEYAAILAGFGLPGDLAAIIANADAVAADGHLFDDGRALSHLIGRPTPPFAETAAAARKAGA